MTRGALQPTPCVLIASGAAPPPDVHALGMAKLFAPELALLALVGAVGAFVGPRRR